MDYTELTITISPFDQNITDIIADYLGGIDYESMLESDTGLKAYIPSTSFNEKVLDFSFVPETSKVEFSHEQIAQQNWNKEWESNFKPVIVEKKCVIKAPFHTDVPKATYEIIIEPKMSFGTGHHETTSLMIEQLLKRNVKNQKVLDMGCGTAVLGILCSMKGATHVDGVDIDEWAYANSIENVERNSIKNMDISQGGIEAIPQQDYDTVIANINRNIVLNDMDTYAIVLKQNGLLLLSGFYMKDMGKILAKAMDLNFSFDGFIEKNNWVSASFVKK